MQIKDRWVGKQDLFLKDRELGDSPFGNKEGRKDYGGIVFSLGQKIVDRVFQSVDFTKASFASTWIELCRFENVIFSMVDISNVSDHGNIFINCIFEKCKFAGSVLGFSGTQFIKTHFVGCSFLKTGFIRAEFTNCNFQECKMNGVDFNASSFEQCDFTGIYKELWFRGGYMVADDEFRLGKPRRNTMKNVSFENAEIHDITFSQGCLLDTVVLPLGENYLRVSDWERRLQNLQHQAALISGPTGKEVRIFSKVHLVHASGQQQFIVNKIDIIKNYGKEAAKIIVDALL